MQLGKAICCRNRPQLGLEVYQYSLGEVLMPWDMRDLNALLVDGTLSAAIIE